MTPESFRIQKRKFKMALRRKEKWALVIEEEFKDFNATLTYQHKMPISHDKWLQLCFSHNPNIATVKK